MSLAKSLTATSRLRNVGIIFAFIFGLMGLYLGATDVIKAQKSKGEVIVFPRRQVPKHGPKDEETNGAVVHEKASPDQKEAVSIQRQTAIFHWQDVCYDVQIKKETRRILDHVDGFIRPGQLTALMVSHSSL